MGVNFGCTSEINWGASKIETPRLHPRDSDVICLGVRLRHKDF